MRQTSFLGFEPEQQSFLPATPPQSTRQRIEALARLKDMQRNEALPPPDAATVRSAGRHRADDNAEVSDSTSDLPKPVLLQCGAGFRLS